MSVRKVPDDNVIIDLYVNQKMSMNSIAKKFNIGIGNHTIKNILLKNNIQIRKDAGENHHFWKGGKIYSGKNGKYSGYYKIWRPNNPHSNKQGYVMEHIVVYEENTGHQLQNKEQIHHINIDKLDNRFENLCLCKNSQEHLNIHRSIEKIIKPLLEKNIIRFNKEKKIYEIC